MSKTCLVTLRHDERQWDLEIPAELPLPELLQLLTASLRLPPAATSMQLYVDSLAAALQGQQTLAELGVLDGAVLTLGAEVATQRGVAPVTDAVGDTPAQGWKALQTEQPVSAPEVPAEKPGFAWKKLED